MKKISRFIAVFAVIAMFCTMMAFATAYESDTETYTAGSNSFDIWSSLYTGSPNTVAAWVQQSDSVKVPVSYMGAQARAYDEDGSLIGYSDWIYNDIVDNFVLAATSVQYLSRMYSMGQVKLYTGTRYLTYDCPQTVMVTGGRSVSSGTVSSLDGVTEYAVNALGETYGSAMLKAVIGYEPDLIAAVGDNGVQGYVRASDLSPEIDTPAEASAYMQSLDEPSVVAVYDLNGNVIGSFTAETVTEPSGELAQEVSELEEANRMAVEAAINSDSGEYVSALGYGLDANESGGRVAGYVSRSDLNGPEVNTLEEATAYMNGFAGMGYSVHLYDGEGNVIGSFKVSGSISASDGMSIAEAKSYVRNRAAE